MKYDPETIAAAFGRLFQTYPSFQAGAADETLRVYFDAVSLYETVDIETAVTNFLSGSAPGHNAAFAPSAPQVAAEARRVMNLRLDSERRMKPYLSLPEPDISADERARVGEGLKQLAQSLRTPADGEERTRQGRERSDREARWLRDRGDLVELPGASFPISRTLARQFGVGDPEGNADAA